MMKFICALLAAVAIFADSIMLPFSDLTEKDIHEIIEQSYQDVVIEFPAQTSFPVHLFLQGDIANLDGKNFGLVTFQQTFYAKILGEDLVLSLDLVNWQPVDEFFTGSLSVNLKVQDGRPCFVMEIVANPNLTSGN